MKRVLVTGGAGFNRVAPVRASAGTGRRGPVRRQLLHLPPAEHRPPRRQPAVRVHAPRHHLAALRRGGPDLHLACPASPVHYQFDPVQTTKTSVHGAINMLGLAKRLKVRILQASTSEITATRRSTRKRSRTGGT